MQMAGDWSRTARYVAQNQRRQRPTSGHRPKQTLNRGSFDGRYPEECAGQRLLFHLVRGTIFARFSLYSFVRHYTSVRLRKEIGMNAPLVQVEPPKRTRLENAVSLFSRGIKE